MISALRRRLTAWWSTGSLALELLAAATFVVTVIETVAWLEGDQVAGTTTALLLVVGSVFTAAALLHRRGHSRGGPTLAGLLLVVLVPVFGTIYHEGRILVLVAPIGFVLLLPHLRGWTLLSIGIATALASLGASVAPLFTDPASSVTPWEVVGSGIGAAAACGLLLVLIWRTFRAAEVAGARYAQLVADLPVGVVRVLADGTLGEANDTLVRMLRYPDRATLLATPGREVYGNIGDLLRGRLAGAGDGLVEGPLLARRHDGTEIWLGVRMRRTLNADGSLRWLEGTVEDVTAERAEREAQGLIGVILTAAPDAIYGLDLEGLVKTWNAEASRAYDISADEALGRNIFDLVPPQQHAQIRELLELVGTGGHFGPLDTPQARRDGPGAILSVTASPMRDADGRITGAVVVARDITEHRRLKIVQANLEDELRQAQKMEAVGRLAGGIAHDFNNLLTAIQGFGRIVAADLDGAALEDQRQVLRAADRAADLTRRLLAFSRRSPVAPRSIMLDTTIEEAFRMTRRLVPERIELTTDLRSATHVLADPIEIEQILLNLVVNAIDAISGAGRIHVMTSHELLDAQTVAGLAGLEAGPYARLVVRDTGRGMDEATRRRIFEPFFTTKAAGEGTGLGLATVYAIAQRSGGYVGVESAPGEGTAFTLLLPAAGAVAAAAPEPAPPITNGSERVLLVEDEEAVRLLTTRILQRAGYSVRAAPGPAQALAIAAGETFDAVITDVIMPGLSGPEMVARLPVMPVVFISGYIGGDGQELGIDRPERRLVTKPFEAGSLTRALRDALDAHAPVPVHTPAAEPVQP